MSRTLRLGLLASVSFASLLGLVACDETRDPPPRPNPDLAVECASSDMDSGPLPDGAVPLACPAGEVCVQGRCYAPCTTDTDCGPRETCGVGGICQGTDTPPPPRDAGPRDGGDSDGGADAGPVDPCASITCDAPLVCHPVAGICTECSERSVGAARGEPGACFPEPICDVANGACVPLTPGPCQPCNLPSDCNEGVDAGAGFSGSCVTRSVFELSEQVCLAPCTASTDCGDGMTCDTGIGFCVPVLSVSCTTFLRGTEGRACALDSDCNPLGDTGAFVTGACVGAFVPSDAGPPPDGGGVDGGPLPDSGPPTDAGLPLTGTCRQPCGTTDDCVDSLVYECNGDGFCVPRVDAGI